MQDVKIIGFTDDTEYLIILNHRNMVDISFPKDVLCFIHGVVRT